MKQYIDFKRLRQKAWSSRERAYAPYSNFLVGAALLTESGEIFTGCNIENISFGLTLCAERAAAANAVQAGQRRFVAIVIVADTASPIAPCGACLQFLAEFNPDLPIHSVGQNSAESSWLLSQLLPSPCEGILQRH